MKTVLLDNEPLSALANRTHRKHRTVTATLVGLTARQRRGAAVRLLLPTAVQVEAGVDRATPGTAVLNRYRAQVVPLDETGANTAARLVRQYGVSVADAHCGAVLQSLAGTDVVVLTSDEDDMKLVASPTAIRTVLI